MARIFRCILGLALISSAQNATSDELQRPDPGKKIRVFLFAGQSNMEGRADGTALSKADLDRLHTAQKRVQLAYNRRPIGPLDVVAPPDDIREIYHVDRIFGPELFFGIAMAEAWPDERFLFIKRAAGATTLYGSWNPEWSEEKAALFPDEEKAKLYSDFVGYVKEVLSGYTPSDCEICGMLWVQGESDGKVEIAAESYGENLRALIDRVRKDIGNDTMPFMLMEVGSPKVIEGMRKTASLAKNVSLLSQSSDPGSLNFLHRMENGHFDSQGLKMMGDRFARDFIKQYAHKGK
jgi:hypothetical protein